MGVGVFQSDLNCQDKQYNQKMQSNVTRSEIIALGQLVSVIKTNTNKLFFKKSASSRAGLCAMQIVSL